jgi:hypothetical protein
LKKGGVVEKRGEEETGEPRENHRPVASHWQTLSHNVVNLTLIAIQTRNISGPITNLNSFYFNISW